MTAATEDEYRFVPGGEQHNEDSPLYKTDEFRMFCFKVLPCSKRYCHDWTTCPFAHPGEKAKRRDPRVHTYTGVACPDMKKNLQCLRADSCPYAHNVFEYYLHPSRYRTQLCNDGVSCRRKVCFFAHTLDELRVSSVKVLPAELGGRLPAPEADPFRNTGQSNNGKYDRDRRISTPAAPRPAASDMRGLLGPTVPQQPSPNVSPVSPLTSNLFDSAFGANGNTPSLLRNSNARHSASNGNTSTSPAPASQSCGQVLFGGSNGGKGFNAPKVPSMQQQQQEWFDTGAASGFVPELQALIRTHQQQNGSNGGATSMVPAPSPGLDLLQIQQLQQLAAAQAQIQAIQAQQHQQALMEQLAASLTQLQLSGALPQHSLNDVVGLLMQQMTAAAATSASSSASQQMLGNIGQQGSLGSSAAAQMFASNSGLMMAAGASQSGSQAQHQMSQALQQQQWSNQGGPLQHPSNSGMQQQVPRTYQDHAIGDLRSYLSSSAVGHVAMDSLQGNQHSYSNGPAMTGMGGADARYANFMQSNASAPAAQHHQSVLRPHTNPSPVIDGPLNQQMLARYSFNNSPPSLLDGQGPISHQELLELASCSNASNSHEFGSMGDILCPLRPFPQAQGFSRSGQSSSGQASDVHSGSVNGTSSGMGLDLGFAASGPLLSGSSDAVSPDSINPGGSLSPATYALLFPARSGSQGSGDLDQGFHVSSDLSSMDPALFSRANYGRAPQVGGPKRGSQQQGMFHNPGYNPAVTASNPGPQQGNNGNNGIVFYRSSVESRSDMSERCSLELASGGGDMGGHGVRSMSSEDSYRYSMGQPAPADNLSALTAAHQRRSMNPEASVNPWATAAAIKVGMKAQRGSTGTEFPGHSKYMFANTNIDDQQGSLDGPIGSDNDEVFGLRKGLDALVGSLRL